MVWIVRTIQGFAEVLVMGVPLRAPAAVPPRYLHRVYARTECRGMEVLHVYSSVFKTPSLLDRVSIAQSGVWIVAADAIPAGEVLEEGVAAKCSVFGLPLAESFEAIAEVCSSVCAPRPQPNLVLYHGSSSSNWMSIAATGLRPSKGMLGMGVYMGSFWKATRFAARTQEYQLREEGGCISRVYVFAASLHAMPARQTPAYVCPCDECATLMKHGSPASLERLAHTDHESRWAADETCDGLYLEPRRCETDARRWIVRNAEWCVRPRCLSVQNGARLDMQSVFAERYDPLQRSQTIL